MTNHATAAAVQTDATLWTLLQVHAHTPVRDARGNLRELTDDELAFGKAVRVEAKRRGLV